MAATKKKADTKKRSQDKVEQTEMGSISALALLEEDHQEVDGFLMNTRHSKMPARRREQR
jgi:hypothetical protein